MSATHVHVDGIVLIIFLLFTSLIALLGSSVYILHSDIEISLMERVVERFEEEGWQFGVTFSGRDGVVSGSVTDEVAKKEVVLVAESVEGVRRIESKLEIISTPINVQENNPDELLALSGITDTTSIVKSLDGIIAHTMPKPTSIDADMADYTVAKSESGRAENLTDMTEQQIIEEVVIQYNTGEIKLSSANEVFLSTLVTKLKNDPLLFIEMSSFYVDSVIAIKRTESIKDYFFNNGVAKKHFDVLWHGSEKQSKVQLKLFRNE